MNKNGKLTARNRKPESKLHLVTRLGQSQGGFAVSQLGMAGHTRTRHIP